MQPLCVPAASTSVGRTVEISMALSSLGTTRTNMVFFNYALVSSQGLPLTSMRTLFIFVVAVAVAAAYIVQYPTCHSMRAGWLHSDFDGNGFSFLEQKRARIDCSQCQQVTAYNLVRYLRLRKNRRRSNEIGQ